MIRFFINNNNTHTLDFFFTSENFECIFCAFHFFPHTFFIQKTFFFFLKKTLHVFLKTMPENFRFFFSFGINLFSFSFCFLCFVYFGKKKKNEFLKQFDLLLHKIKTFFLNFKTTKSRDLKKIFFCFPIKIKKIFFFSFLFLCVFKKILFLQFYFFKYREKLLENF